MASVSSIYLYPDSGAAAQQVTEAHVTRRGIDGDAAGDGMVRLASAEEYVVAHPAANLVLDIAPRTLHDLAGKVVAIGEVVMHVSPDAPQGALTPATIASAGDVAVGDDVLVGS